MKSPVLKIAAALLFAALAVPFFFGCAAPAPATDCAGITRPGSYSELFALITARTESETVKALAGVTSDNFGLNHAKGVNFDFSASSGSPAVVMPDRFVSDGKVLYSLYSTFSDCYGTYSALTVTELSPDSPDDSSTYFFCGSLFDISSDPGLEDQQIIDVVEPEGMFLCSDRLVVVGDQLSCRFSSEKYASLTEEAEKAAKKCYEKVEHYFPGTFEEYLEAFLGAQDVDGDGKRDGEYFDHDACFYRDIVDCCDSVEKRACAFVFDVSNPYKPVFLSKCGVGGSYSASACSGGSIRLISNFVSCDPVEDSLKSFVPHVLRGGVESPVDFSQVAVTKNAGALGRIDCYTVLTIDPSDASVTDSLVVYSDCEGAYFTENDLFTYNTYIKSERGDGAVSESLSRPSYTDVFRISLAGGAMRVVSEGSLRGVPEDLNSLDWDGKHLRAVTKLTTALSATCVEIRDSEALEAAAKKENRCSITVLDGDLEILGELEDCPGVDYIYSVRFDGDLVYLLNYSASSPLAAFDLSDPGSPKPLSESASAKARRDLKGDLLLAVGQSASRHTSVSLFPLGSVLSPKPCAVNVSERYRSVYFTLDPSAVFCDPENSLTGFYAGGTFYFYRYDPDSVSFTETSVDLSPLSGVNDVRAFGACGSVFILSHRALIRLDADTLSPVKEELFFPASGSGFLRTSPENRQPELPLPAYYY